MDQILKSQCDVRAEGSSFINSALTSHLQDLGYPERSLNSLRRCGISTGFKAMLTCGCGNKIISLTHRCNNRSCSRCSVTRKRRFVRRLTPILESISTDRTYFFYSLTFSPQNYIDETPNFGISHVKKTFSKFLRQKYMKERISGGLYVIEVKGGSGNWNIHIHAILYGRWLDNRLRGTCLDCGQHLIKHDKQSLKYYCASKKCNSLNVSVKSSTKLSRAFEKASGVSSRAWITRQNTKMHTLNYMLKHIGANKDEFHSDLDFAKYICAMHSRPSLHVFGAFYGYKPKKRVYCCAHCSQSIHICVDQQLIKSIEDSRNHPPNPQKTFFEFTGQPKAV